MTKQAPSKKRQPRREVPVKDRARRVLSELKHSVPTQRLIDQAREIAYAFSHAQREIFPRHAARWDMVELTPHDVEELSERLAQALEASLAQATSFVSTVVKHLRALQPPPGEPCPLCAGRGRVNMRNVTPTHRHGSEVPVTPMLVEAQKVED